MRWLLRLFRRQPKVWLVNPYTGGWHKVVSPSKPDCCAYQLLGPFRSEVDAEETADRLNAAIAGRLKIYHPTRMTEAAE